MKRTRTIVLFLATMLFGISAESLAEQAMISDIKAFLGHLHSQQQAPEEQWWSIFMQDAKVGYMYFRTEMGAYEGEEIVKEYSEAVIEVKRAGSTFRTVSTAVNYWTSDYSLRYFMLQFVHQAAFG